MLGSGLTARIQVLSPKVARRVQDELGGNVSKLEVLHLKQCFSKWWSESGKVWSVSGKFGTLTLDHFV